MRIGMEDHRARRARATADRERALEDVPDLREVMVVHRMMGPGLEAQDAGVRFCGPFRTRMEQHLAGLAGPSDGFPFDVVAMPNLHRLMRWNDLVCRHTLSIGLPVRQADTARVLRAKRRPPARRSRVGVATRR